MIFSSLKKEKSAIILFVMILSIGTFSLNFFYSKKAQGEFTSFLAAHKENIESENYFKIVLNTRQLKLNQPNFRSFAFYVRGHLKSGQNQWPQYLEEPKVLGLRRSGFFSYELSHKFENSEHIIFASYQDINLLYHLLFVFWIALILPGILFVLRRKFDIDNQQSLRNDYAVAMSAKAIHFVKTHLHYANELYKWSEESSENNKEFLEVREGFKNSQIEMEGIRSVLRLSSFKKSKNFLDVEDNIDFLLKCYKNDKTYVKKYFKHKSKLHLDRDIFIATVGNIIKNACEYSADLIWIKTEENKNTFSIQVSNTGRTLSKKDIRNILKEGQSLEGLSGLGLSICQVWMNKIGGELKIDSHKGSSTFELIFPHKMDKHETISGQRAPLSKNAKKVAVIEDIPSLRRNTCESISACGYEVDAFADVDSFFNIFEKNYQDYSIIVIDRHLKQGFDAVRDRFVDACHYFGYQEKIILYTGDCSPAENKNAEKDFDLVLHKGELLNWQEILRKI